MRTGQVMAIVVIVAVIALGVTIAYSLSTSGRSTTTSSGSLFSQLTTYTTVIRTTLPVGGSTYFTTTGLYQGCIPPVQCYLTTVTTVIYVSAPPTTASTVTKLYTVVQSNFTVHGQAAGIPCGALRIPCISSANQTIVANLVRYQGTYYYDSNYTLNTVVYMIWYNNSTYYCVSPTPPTNEQAKSCP
jgi:hypothetical protein